MTSQKEIEQLRQLLREQSEEAAANELILRRAQKRELSLLEADSLVELFDRMTNGLKESFGIPAVSLVMCDPHHEVRHLVTSLNHQPVPPDVLLVDRLEFLPGVYNQLSEPRLGPFQENQRLLFPFAEDIASSAILPLAREKFVIGSINLGSRDAERFKPDHATDIMAHLGVIASFSLENAVNRARLRLSGLTDPLTDWHNRRYLEVRLKEEIARAQRNGYSISCLMIDIDHFKRVNDSLGHLAGDEVLREVSRRIATQVRESDVAARFGGEEFVVILPDTPERNARNLAERVRRVVRATPILAEQGQALTITVSAGVASIRPKPRVDPLRQGNALIEAADSAMYRAKKTGRDRVLTAETVPIANEID
ncbi:MAG: sensor domain-containing diguanylate cyclase [Gammaproteobacteria bacterium]|nr:sensor domain-containing diguanylate cyclase [Gammaproteobacteria bacterium]NNF67199.1 sensor domain-containing diguanylate cyclase [Gammaproteobacteria bacterium]